jgi:hypothetical protein
VRDEHTHCACNCILLCWRCHFDVHANPLASKKAGWIVSRFIAYPGHVALEGKRTTWYHNCEGQAVGMTFSH